MIDGEHQQQAEDDAEGRTHEGERIGEAALALLGGVVASTGGEASTQDATEHPSTNDARHQHQFDDHQRLGHGRLPFGAAR